MSEEQGAKMEWTFRHRSECPGCGQKGARALYSRHIEPRVKPPIVFDFLVCPLCGVIFQDPIMTEETINQFYAMEYRTLTSRGQREGPLQADIDLEKRRGQRIIDSYTEYFKANGGGEIFFHTSWLDVGCATGEMLSRLSDGGWHVAGVEPNESTRKLARDKDLAILESLEAVGSRHDVVSALHVLEHVRDPHAFLLEMRTKVRSCGIIIIDVPHAHGLQNRACAFPHLQVYTVPSLVKQVQRAGFTVLATKEVRDPQVPPLYSDITLIAETNPQYNGSESEPAPAVLEPIGGNDEQ